MNELGVERSDSCALRGLELCQRYFEAFGRPAFLSLGTGVYERLAFGLVGEGSDCFGYDDALSRDHDWGPGFSVWYDELDLRLNVAQLEQVYAELPTGFEALVRATRPEAIGRVGVVSIQAFYRRLIGRPSAPVSSFEWLNIPESALAAATNGLVFEEGSGAFSSVRETLLAFYPEEVRLKKLAAKLAVIGQAGQYNLPRCLERGDVLAASAARADMMQAYIQAAHLLERRYCPYYKWAGRSLSELEAWTGAHEALKRLAAFPVEAAVSKLLAEVEYLLSFMLSQLRRQSLCFSESDFLPDLASSLQAQLSEERLRQLPLMLG